MTGGKVYEIEIVRDTSFEDCVIELAQRREELLRRREQDAEAAD